MAILCKCDGGLGNTGRPGGCDKPLTVPKGLFLVQTYDATGAKNFVDPSVVVDDAFITAKINQTDASKRWYPLNGIENFASDRGEAAYETAPSGRKAFVKNGERDFSFELWDGGAVLMGKIDLGRCKEFSIFILTGGRITGMDLDGDGTKLYPIRVAKNSLATKYVYATDTTKEKVTVAFQYATAEEDGNMRFLQTTADVLGYTGLVDIQAAYSNITTTGFKAQLFHDFDALNDKGVLTGLVAGDFALFNTTTSTAVTITSVAYDVTAKKYTFVFAAQAVGSKLRLTPTKAGYDTGSVVTNLVTIP